jgi:hypothetical protein
LFDKKFFKYLFTAADLFSRPYLIYATGSTKSRTRLYRIGITKYLQEIRAEFELYGQVGDEWHEFTVGVEYEAFLAKRKKKKNGKEKNK